MKRLVWALIAAFLAASPTTVVAAQRGTAPAAPKPAASGPVIVIETAKGTIEFETYPNDAPKTVERILALVKRNFFNGMRVHRVVKGFVMQFGDPQSRDMTKRDRWGSMGSGRPIGVAEIKRPHKLGSVAAAHPGNPRDADSQMYIVIGPPPKLEREYTVFGQVTSGLAVAQKLEVGDVVKKVSLKP